MSVSPPPVISDDDDNNSKYLISLGVIFSTRRLEEEEGVSDVVVHRAVVICRLSEKPEKKEQHWTPELAADVEQLELVVDFYFGLPPSLPQRHAAAAHALGDYVACAWQDGAIVNCGDGRCVLAELQPPDRLVFSVRGPKLDAASWEMLRADVERLRREKDKRLPGVEFELSVTCPSCLKKNRIDPYRFEWDDVRDKTEVDCPLCNKRVTFYVADADDDESLAGTTPPDNAGVVKLIAQVVEGLREVQEVQEVQLELFGAVDERLQVLDGKLDRNLEAIKGNLAAMLSIADDDHLYPRLFFIVPAPEEQNEGLLGWLKAPNDIFNRKLMVVFVCERTGRSAVYGGEGGLVFKVPKPEVTQALDFWKRYGPIIKLSATALCALVKAGFNINLDALVPKGAVDALSRSLDAADFIKKNAAQVGKVVDAALTAADADRPTMESIRPVDDVEGVALDDPNLTRIGKERYKDFGRLLVENGFDLDKLGMKRKFVDGGFVWFSVEEDTTKGKTTADPTGSQKIIKEEEGTSRGKTRACPGPSPSYHDPNNPENTRPRCGFCTLL
jgi:hypothetical protein